MKIYDCFLFYNELDILEIRLKELYDIVDCFVIAESNLTFTGLPKEYTFEKNKERFAPYLDKIRHFKIEDGPDTTDPWERERHQRRALGRGLTGVNPEDWVIISDADEVPRASLVQSVKNGEIDHRRILCFVPQFNFRLNYMKVVPNAKHSQMMFIKFKYFTDTYTERKYSFFWVPKPEDTVAVDHAGWHFTFFGNDAHCLKKIGSYSHTEANTENVRNNFNIENMIKNRHGFDVFNNPNDNETFEPVIIDDYFPKAVYQDQQRWQSMIIPNATRCVTDFYKK